MSDTLRNQLLGLGFKPAPKPAKDARPPKRDGKGAKPPRKDGKGGRRDASSRPGRGDAGHAATGKGRGAGGKARSQGDIELAKAYAIRAQREKDERIAAERAKQEEARLRREARARLAILIDGKALNSDKADIARHFEYGGKIKRIYVTDEQLKALNAGELGVIQQNGRYLLVTSALLAEAEATFAPCVALKVDPNAPVADDPYADPKYQVPDDLVW